MTITRTEEKVKKLQKTEPVNKIVQTVKVGRYTIVEIQTEDGVKAVGIARRSQGDKDRPEVGENIAISRAIKSAERKAKNKTVQNPLMG